METVAIRAEIQRLEKELSAIDAKRKELEHWRSILSLRDNPVSKRVAKKQSAAPNATPTAGAKLTTGRTEEYGAKAKAMRVFTLSRNGDGVTMREFIDEGKRLGARPQFPYQWVNRQRKAKPPRLRKEGKKFFATEHLAA